MEFDQQKNVNFIKSTKDLFKKLKIDANTLTIDQKKFLETEGYLILKSPKFISENLINLRKLCSDLIAKEGSKGGWEGKEKNFKVGKHFEPGSDRLGNLVNKDEVFGKIILIPEILAAAYEVIKDDLKISGLNFRNPKKNSGRQAYHIDIFPRKKNDDNYSGVVCYIYLDDTKIENGATRIIPKTHKLLGWPEDYIDTSKDDPREIRTIVKAGTVVILNLNTWHAGAENLSGEDRKTIFLQIKKRNESQLLNYKKFLTNNTKQRLNDFQKYLLAIRKEDVTQKEDSFSVGEFYRKVFGKDRGALSK